MTPTHDDKAREALELARSALIAAQPRDIGPEGWKRHEDAINALNAALSPASSAGQEAVTPEMIASAEAVDDLYRMGRPELWARVYRVMRAAAPQQVAEAEIRDRVIEEAAEVAVQWDQFDIARAIRALKSAAGSNNGEKGAENAN